MERAGCVLLDGSGCSRSLWFSSDRRLGGFRIFISRKRQALPSRPRPGRRVTWPPVGLLLRVHGFATWRRNGLLTARQPTISGAARKHATTRRPPWRLGSRVPAGSPFATKAAVGRARFVAGRRPTWQGRERSSRPCRAAREPMPPRSDRPSSWSTGSRGGWRTSGT